MHGGTATAVDAGRRAVGRPDARRSWYRRSARIGLGARAVVYLVLGYLAFDIALTGSSPTSASGTGALAEVARQPAGRPLLCLLAAGLLAYAAWRCAGAVARDLGEVDRARRAGWLAIAAVYLGLLVEAAELVAGSGASGGPSSHPAPYVAAVLRWPGGPGWVGLGGVAVVAAGVALAAWGVTHDYRRELTAGSLGRRTLLLVRGAGAIGNVTRGSLATLLGAFLVAGAVTDDPAKAKSLDAALLALSHQPYGPALLGLIGAGLLAYAAFSVAEASARAV
ncbi:MAG: DUF1206 domain-containing protein [Acidimicrobiales bacterium]